MCAILAVLMLAGCFLLTACQKPAEEEPLQEKYLREIQTAYDAEMAKEENQTTAAMVQLTEQYAKAWQAAAKDACDRIQNYKGNLRSNDRFDSVSELQKHVTEAQREFDETYETKCAAYLKTLQETHGGGSIVGLSMAVFDYDLQKDWALTVLELYDTCCQ